MKLEKQVCSLELAKKLKELGVPQDGAFYWKDSNNTLKYDDGTPVEIETELLFGKTPVFKTLGTWEPYTAYTVAELGELLPRTIDNETMSEWFLKLYQHQDNDWVCEYIDRPPYRNVHASEFDKTEANARARMLIYLHENNLLN